MKDIKERLDLVSSESLKSVKNLLDYDRLTEFKFAEGGEGKAYFLGSVAGKPLVLKEFIDDFSSVGSEFGEIFDMYCAEVKRLSESGVKLPNFYDWYFRKNELGNKIYYILQDEIKGREIFSPDPFSFYKNIYLGGQVDMNEISLLSEKGLEKDAVLSYIRDYIMINKFIEEMPESELAKFILDAFKIYSETDYVVPDVTERNVIANLDNQTLTHIDPYMIDKRRDGRYHSENHNERMQKYFDNIIMDMVRIFRTNNFATLSSNDNFLKLTSDDFNFRREVARLVMKNSRICEASLTRILGVMNKLLGNPKLKNSVYYKRILFSLNSIFTTRQMNKVLESINVDEKLKY